jgi:mono/diheme cytochrome c family protein
MRLPLPLLALASLAAGMPAHADIKRGADLHQNNCVACHAQMVGGDGSLLYTRPDRRIQSRPALERQVRRCKENLGLTWFDEEVADVVEFLDARYYKLAP